MEDLIRIEHINKRYGGAWALRDAAFSMAPGEVHALMGENGAGKSTLGKIVAGAVMPDSAEVQWNGQTVKIESPQSAQRLGIGIVFQELDLFPNLSIVENIAIGNLHAERRPWVNWRELIAFCQPYLDQVGLTIDPRTKVGKIPIGHMQLVAIARALSFQARLLVLDEPTSSLSDDAVRKLFAVIGGLKEKGVSIVYVTHKMAEVFEIADRVTVLRDGQTIGTRRTAETTIDEIITMMVGRELGELTAGPSSKPSEILLSVEGISTARLRNVSFTVRRGEVLGIAGLVGAGRSEIGAALFGLDRITGGKIVLKQREVQPGSPRQAMQLGIGLLPEDRKLQGLMMHLGVLENSTISILDRLQKWGFVKRRLERESASREHNRVALKARSGTVSVGDLSGGNQQKVLLSKWLLVDPDVLFLDDPTRGIDIGAKRDIYQIIENLSASGKGVILVSSELPELLLCCHRIMVMREGATTGVVESRSTTQEQIMQLATAGSEAA